MDAVSSVCPKFMPTRVTPVAPMAEPMYCVSEAAPLYLIKLVTTGASKLKPDWNVPTTVERVIAWLRPAPLIA
jgi:hypothetical protein